MAGQKDAGAGAGETGPDKEKTAVSKVFGWLGEHRDGFLVGGAVLYGLGYLVWSYNAWRNHLGQLPAADFQYVIAGVFPAAVIMVGWAGAAFFYGLRDKTVSLFEKYGFLKRIVVAVLMVVITGFAILLTNAATGWINTGWTKEQIVLYTGPTLAVLAYFSFITQLAMAKDRDSFVGRMSELSRYLLPLSFCWYSLFIFIDLYPRLPQGLGGPQPRCAYVDVVRDDTASSTIAALVPGEVTSSSPKVIRSRKLNVYFSSSDYLLVRVADDAAQTDETKLKDVPLYELRKEVIRVVEWCRE